MKNLLFIFLGLVVFSCTTDPVGNGNGRAALEGVMARLVVSGYSRIESRATDDNALVDVWVLQYIDSTLVGKTFLGPGTQWFDGFTLPAQNMPAGLGNVVYFFANTVAIIGADPIGTDAAFTVNTATIDDLEAYEFPLTETSFDPYLPMRGQFTGEIRTGSTTPIAVTLERMAAKINFTFDATALNQFIATSIQLCQVPQITALPRNPYQPALPVGGATAPNPPNFTPYPAGNLFADYTERTIAPNLSETGSALWYMPENVRGSFPLVSSNSQKFPGSAQIPATDQEKYTYILLKGTCIDNSNNLVNVSYRIYLGGNELGDMNLIANTIYSVTTRLTGTNTADTRITSEPVDVTDALEESNSYILNPNGALQTFNIPVSQAVRGIEAVNATPSSPGMSFDPASAWTAQILWQTWQATTTANQLSVSRLSTATGNYIRVVLPAGVVSGNNAVIALKSANGTTLWSWHLWITDYNPDATGTTPMNGELHSYGGPAFGPGGALEGKQMMDRDLGATWTGGAPFPSSTPAQAATAYGLFYQWGRKDPFTQSNGSISTPVTIYGGEIGSSPLPEGTGGGPGINRVAVPANTMNNLVNAVQNPTTFYYRIASPYDWYTTSTVRANQNDNLWGNAGDKSVFDPCPVGYRVPKSHPTNILINPWSGFGNGNGITEGVNENFAWYANGVRVGTTTSDEDNPTGGRLYTGTTPNAWYPVAGLREAVIDGQVNRRGRFSGAWSATVYSSTAIQGLYMSSTNLNVTPSASSFRSYGFEVRCVQE